MTRPKIIIFKDHVLGQENEMSRSENYQNSH